MAILDGDIGERLRCDRCGVEMSYEESAYEVKDYWLYDVFKGRQRAEELYGDYCKPCAKILTPWVWRLRDIDETNYSIAKLKKAIDDRKARNNGATENTTRKFCPCCGARRYGYRQSGSASQIMQEH